jgi:putative hydrolase of the HAD superfamily
VRAVFSVVFFDLDDTLFDRGAALAKLDARARSLSGEAFALEVARVVEPEPGVRHAIAALARERRVAIVTNGGTRAQRAKLARIGLDDVVHAVFVSAEVGAEKPARAIFERALAWAERPARDCLFVGDDPLRDIAPAAALGMATAWRARAATWPSELPRARFDIRSISEVAALC